MKGIARWKSRLTWRIIISAMAIAMVASVGTDKLLAPVAARAAAAAARPARLDDTNLNALLSLDKAMETLAARVTPAIVNVTVTSRSKAEALRLPEDMQQFFGPFGEQFFGRSLRPPAPIEHGLGSGVIISPNGYIVTNDHVVDGALDIRVAMSNRRILPAKLIGRDPLTDLAVLKVEATNLASVPWGDSTQLHPGQTVLAFGNPLGFRFSVTRGIVSALNRPNPYSEDRRSPGQFIQTDAAINQGNSGGPLVDARGEVVGINTFLISPSGAFSGMGFAIPTQIVRPTVETLIKEGQVRHGYIGIGINDVTPDNAKFFDVKNNEGAVVSEVEADSPGEKAGLRVGDVITGINGQPVGDAGQLQVEVGQKSPGTTVHLQLLHNGKTMDVPVTLGAMDRGERKGEAMGDPEHGKPRWGLAISDLTPAARDQIQAPTKVRGALIERVDPGSPADDAGLRRGDLILEVNRKPVENAADAQKALSSIPKGQEVLLLVWSNSGSTFRVLHPAEG